MLVLQLVLWEYDCKSKRGWKFYELLRDYPAVQVIADD